MSTDTETSELISEVRYLARVRVHRLASRQLAALETQTTASIRAMKTYLEGRPVDQQVAAQAHDWERRAWAAQTRDMAAAKPGAIAAEVHRASEAAQGISPYAKAGGMPAGDEPNSLHVENEEDRTPVTRNPAPARRVPFAERPKADGYFHHEGRIYKVATSQYGSSKGHLFARKLDEQTGEWIPAKGMTSYLSEAERITAEKAMEIGRKLSQDPSLALYGKCWICGRVLTDEESIRNGKGPGPHQGMDD